MHEFRGVDPRGHLGFAHHLWAKPIDIIKSRLIKNFAYNEVSATDVLNYVASIFARGDAKG
jgi:hypothetical protein